MTKLHDIAIQDYLLGSIEQFLHRRMMEVEINSTVSKPVYTASGAPQGSVIGGPLLFLMHTSIAHWITNPL